MTIKQAAAEELMELILASGCRAAVSIDLKNALVTLRGDYADLLLCRRAIGHLGFTVKMEDQPA